MDSGRYKSGDVSARAHTDPKRVVRGPTVFPRPVREYFSPPELSERPSYTRALHSSFPVYTNPPLGAGRLQWAQNIRPSIVVAAFGRRPLQKTLFVQSVFISISTYCYHFTLVNLT